MRDGAAVIFLRDGYAGASVDDITREAQVSKATLYSYFPEKSIMFHAAMQAELGVAFGKCPFDKREDGDVPDILPEVLTALANWSAAEQRVRLLRIIIAEGMRFPDIVTNYDSAFDRRIIKPLQALINVWIGRGQIKAHDSDQSARQLVAVVMGQVQQHAMLTGYRFTKEQLATCGQAASHLFLCTHTVIDNKVL